LTQSRTGVVVGKDFRPPEGERVEDWCYLIIDLSEDERVSVRLDSTQIGKATLGDLVRFPAPSGPDVPVQRLVRM
jgi:hypothetical protein